MVGPNFHTPASPPTQHYTKNPLPEKTVGQSQHFNMGKDIPAEWWTLFHSPELNDLIRAGLANSPNLAAARATLRQAHETLNAQVGSLLLPTVNAQVAGDRSLASGLAFAGNNSSTLFNVYNTSVNVSYLLDIFGGSRREIESVRAQVDYEQYELIAAYLTLTSNIVTTTITLASLQAQIEATHELVQLQEKQLTIIKKQYQLGGASETNVLAQQTQLAQTQAFLPPLEKSMAQSRHALAVLIGSLPSETVLPRFNLNSFKLPRSLPVSLPSTLTQQRPDVRASEALLHSASAQVGVATANLFPQITLTGNYGWLADAPSNLFKPTTNVWGFGSQLLQPLFQGGALQAQKRAAIAAYEQALAQYHQTVLQAFQNVADTLRALELDAKTLRADRKAENAAKNTFVIIQKQLRLGGVSYLDLLNANMQYQQTRINRIQAEALRFADTAALFQALGGGWWNIQGGLLR